eukprot:10655841-Prorocentrum_lima.AAC.1
MTSAPQAMRDIDNRLSFMLLKCLPEKMKGRVIEEAEGDMGVDISTICVLDTAWEDVAPGGQEELREDDLRVGKEASQSCHRVGTVKYSREARTPSLETAR